jgi:hypothetical protein
MMNKDIGLPFGVTIYGPLPGSGSVVMVVLSDQQDEPKPDGSGQLVVHVFVYHRRLYFKCFLLKLKPVGYSIPYNLSRGEEQNNRASRRYSGVGM